MTNHPKTQWLTKTSFIFLARGPESWAVTAVGCGLTGLGSRLCLGFRSALGVSCHAGAGIYLDDILMAMAEMQKG